MSRPDDEALAVTLVVAIVAVFAFGVWLGALLAGWRA